MQYGAQQGLGEPEVFEIHSFSWVVERQEEVSGPFDENSFNAQQKRNPTLLPTFPIMKHSQDRMQETRSIAVSRTIGTGSRPLKSEFKTEVLRGYAAYGIETECFADRSTLREEYSQCQSGPGSDVRELYQESSKWRAKFGRSCKILSRQPILTILSTVQNLRWQPLTA